MGGQGWGRSQVALQALAVALAKGLTESRMQRAGRDAVPESRWAVRPADVIESGVQHGWARAGGRGEGIAGGGNSGQGEMTGKRV